MVITGIPDSSWNIHDYKILRNDPVLVIYRASQRNAEWPQVKRR